MPAGRPPVFETPEQMEAAIEDYFNPLVKNEAHTKSGVMLSEGPERGPRAKVTITGLALHLGFCDRQSLYDYEDKPEFSCIVKKARLRVEMSYEERLSESACTGAIFALKNMGWKDKTETEHSGNLAIHAKYNNQPGNDPLNE
jgi:hypothetical protein